MAPVEVYGPSVAFALQITDVVTGEKVVAPSYIVDAHQAVVIAPDTTEIDEASKSSNIRIIGTERGGVITDKQGHALSLHAGETATIDNITCKGVSTIHVSNT